MTPVESSMFSAIGYDAEGMTLYLEFHATKNKPAVTWAYKNFISERWDEMCAAESIGKWFLANVKGKYEGAKVDFQAAFDAVAAEIKRDTDASVESVKADIRDNPNLKPGTPILGYLEPGGKFTPADPGAQIKEAPEMPVAPMPEEA